ncbi:MAG: hypothetical protein CVT71_01330 [Alphaproteobacteria bacterium HGW-Alphaproteobacteria-10]|nr:MAG: hypothetical protein CVT71_01330 [Alphaproteobacteria bacterium HGW-Alphaproteobacteria-10]
MYARAFGFAGARVAVASLVLPAEDAAVAAEIHAGVHHGIPFEHVCGKAGRPRSFWRRRLRKVAQVARMWRLVARATSGPGCGAVLIYSASWTWIALLTVITRFHGGVALLDLCELPRPRELRGLRAALYRLGERLFPRLPLDGVVVISSYLEEYVARGPRHTPTLRVPVMVDADAFGASSAPSPSAVPRRIVYCGALGKYEEVQRAIRAFAAVAAGEPDVELVLVGSGPDHRLEQAQELARAIGVESRVRFAGDTAREDLPAVFESAEVFVLPRPASLVAAAGLPNKLGEYLAAGRPVIVNANGDIPRYLRDGVDAHVVDPDDEDAFVERLRSVLADRAAAAAMGVRGRAVAAREFDYRVHAPRLLEFVERLWAERRRRGGQ